MYLELQLNCDIRNALLTTSDVNNTCFYRGRETEDRIPVNIIFYKHIDFARRKNIKWFGHFTRRPGPLAHTVMHNVVLEAEDGDVG